MKNKKYIVYKITNKLNNMIYIGCHNTFNIKDNYIGSGTNIKKAIKEFGKENFIKEILYVYDNKEDMLKKEAELVNDNFIARDDTYNIIIGGGNFYINNCLIVKDKNDNIMMIHKTDPRWLSGELISIHKNKILVKDKDGNVFQIDKNDERYLSGELIPECKNTTVIKDKYNNIFRVNINDPRYLSGELVGIAKNKIIVKDKNGNNYQVDKNDEKYLSGELISIHKNKVNVIDKNNNIFKIYKHEITPDLKQYSKNNIEVIDKNGNIFFIATTDEKYLSGIVKAYKVKNHLTVKDINGNNYRININDPKYLSGELIPISKNKVTVKDIDNNYYQVDKTDERYLSGELIPIKKGIKCSKESKELMSKNHADFSGKKNPCFGKKCIHNPITKQVKYINENELESYINDGWIKGSKNKGKKYKN